MKLKLALALGLSLGAFACNPNQPRVEDPAVNPNLGSTTGMTTEGTAPSQQPGAVASPSLNDDRSRSNPRTGTGKSDSGSGTTSNY